MPSTRLKHNRDHARMCELISAGQPFTGSNFWGVPNTFRYVYSGRMPEPHAEEFDNATRLGMVDYIIYSYATPIAYRMTGTRTWIIPPVKYSPSTGKHQSMLYNLPT